MDQPTLYVVGDNDDQPKPVPVKHQTPVSQGVDDWREIMQGDIAGGKVAGAWKRLLKFVDWGRARPVWRWYLKAAQADGKTFVANPSAFVERFGTLERMMLEGRTSERETKSSRDAAGVIRAVETIRDMKLPAVPAQEQAKGVRRGR